MNLSQWPWQKLAIGAAAFTAVIVIGFLSDNTGPVQGGESRASIYRSGEDCGFDVRLAFGDRKDKQESWTIYMSDLECIINLDSQGGKTSGRPGVHKAIEAVRGKAK